MRCARYVLGAVILLSACTDAPTQQPSEPSSGTLLVRPVLQTGKVDGPPETNAPVETAEGTTVISGSAGYVYVVGDAGLNGDIFEEEIPVLARTSDTGTQWTVVLEVRSEAAAAWSDIVEACSALAPACPTGQIALIADGRVIVAPRVTPELDAGLGILSLENSYTEEQARSLAQELSGE